MVEYFDAHCHLPVALVPDSQIGMIVNSAKFSEFDSVSEISAANQNVYGAIGIHPWYIHQIPTDWDSQLYNRLIARPDLMVGEVGLDSHRPDIGTQLHIFERQFEIACDLHRGIQVHCVGAWDKMFTVLKRYAAQLPPFILFHRYSGAVSDIAGLAATYNAYFSYSGSHSPKRIIATPATRILSETDSAPGASIIDVVSRLSAVSGLSPAIFVNNAQEMVKKCHD